MTRKTAARALRPGALLALSLLWSSASIGAEMGAAAMQHDQDHFNAQGSAPVTVALSERPGCGEKNSAYLPIGLSDCSVMGFMAGPSTVRVTFTLAPKQ
jgi:hypothetical protein